MSMKMAIKFLHDEVSLERAGARDNVATLDDVLGVLLRLDPYTIAAAEKRGCAPESVTEEEREAAKRQAHRDEYVRRAPFRV